MDMENSTEIKKWKQGMGSHLEREAGRERQAD